MNEALYHLMTDSLHNMSCVVCERHCVSEKEKEIYIYSG